MGNTIPVPSCLPSSMIHLLPFVVVVVVSRELTSEIDKRKDVLLNACEENEQLQEKKLLGFFLLSFFQFGSQKLAVTILGSSKL